jgi:hypothetical protein
MSAVGRLAPSPTGSLHAGNVRTFLWAWLSARAQGGRVLLRVEDLDQPRAKPGVVERMIDELRWLGFDWDGPVEVQSARRAHYRAVFERLRAPSSRPRRARRTRATPSPATPGPAARSAARASAGACAWTPAP